MSELVNIQVTFQAQLDSEEKQKRKEIAQIKTDLSSYLQMQKNMLDETHVHEETNVKISCQPSAVSDQSTCMSNREQEESKFHTNMDKNKKLLVQTQNIERIFNIKTLEVSWNEVPSYMHVFIDTTDIRKLEEANNNIKLHRIMFASVSHEFRNPLNAIINSYQFISSKFESILQSERPLESD